MKTYEEEFYLKHAAKLSLGLWQYQNRKISLRSVDEIKNGKDSIFYGTALNDLDGQVMASAKDMFVHLVKLHFNLKVRYGHYEGFVAVEKSLQRACGLLK